MRRSSRSGARRCATWTPTGNLPAASGTSSRHSPGAGPNSSRPGRAGSAPSGARCCAKPSPTRSSATSSPISLEALVTLVVTFNEGLILERLSGIETGHARPARVDRRLAHGQGGRVEMTITHGAATAHRADARPLSRAEGYVERDGVRTSTRPTATATHGPAHADLVDHPFALLEAAGAVPGAPIPSGHVRRARQREVGPPARSRAVRRAEFAADALAVMDATGTDPEVVASRCLPQAHRALAAPRGGPSGAGRRSRLSSSPIAADRARRCPGAREQHRSSTNGASSTRAGISGTVTTGVRETTEDFLEFFFSQAFNEPHSTKQREDRGRLGFRHGRRDAGRDPARADGSRTPMRGARADRQDPLPGARDPRPRDDAIRPHDVGRQHWPRR